MLLLNFFFITVFSLNNSLSHNWILTSASLSSCPGGEGEFFVDGFDQNCFDSDDGRICNELFMGFESDGSYNLRVETRHVESGERYVSYSYDGRYSVGSVGSLTTCDPDMKACEEMTYQIDRDELVIRGLFGCDGTMTFERVREDRH
jgi:hypothetical protein